jgi:hypothetical protein
MSLDTTTRHAQDVLTYIKRQFGDESGVQITDQDIMSWINLAQMDIATITKCIQGRATGDILSGQFEYQIPVANALEITTLRFNGNPITGVEFTQAEQILVTQDPNRNSKGQPVWWTRWANTISIYPTPDQDYPGSLTIYYYGAPADVTSAGDLLSLPDRHYPAILFYCLSKAYELDEDYSASSQAYQNYQNKLGDTLDDETKALNLFYPTITMVDFN